MGKNPNALDYNKIADHFDFIAKMLRGSRTVSVVNPDGSKAKPIGTWKAAAEEAEYAAKAIRSALKEASDNE